ncbi:hypothetical protein [Catellatospora sichuanensis]|uniref:hypothetical protein n=1 Tax=Catellatospora sichuanensis TaxID=1969805 RepID=UPI0011838251|nr:hypothetical protein [Catellatospora sichuanensis]
MNTFPFAPVNPETARIRGASMANLYTQLDTVLWLGGYVKGSPEEKAYVESFKEARAEALRVR